MKCRKSVEAHNQFQSGWVTKVFTLQTQEDQYVLTAKGLHSQRLSEEPLKL